MSKINFHTKRIVEQRKNRIDRAEDICRFEFATVLPEIISRRREVEKEKARSWDCYSGGKKSAVKYSTLYRRPDGKVHFNYRFARRSTVFAHVHGGNFSLTANTPVNSVGSLTRKAGRASARDAVIKFRTTLPRSVKNLLLRSERACKKERPLNNDPPPSASSIASKTRRTRPANKYARVHFSKLSIRE